MILIYERLLLLRRNKACILYTIFVKLGHVLWLMKLKKKNVNKNLNSLAFSNQSVINNWWICCTSNEIIHRNCPHLYFHWSLYTVNKIFYWLVIRTTSTTYPSNSLRRENSTHFFGRQEMIGCELKLYLSMSTHDNFNAYLYGLRVNLSNLFLTLVLMNVSIGGRRCLLKVWNYYPPLLEYAPTHQTLDHWPWP